MQRWVRGSPGCTFSRGEDGKYRYQLASEDYDVTIAVDSQELTEMRKRVEPFFGVLVAIRFHGHATLVINPNAASFEFVSHHNVVQYALDPETFAIRTQDDADQLEFDTEREIKKHPERKEQQEKYVQEYQKDVTNFLDFLSRNTLPAVQLDSANPEATGWVLFSTRNKWLGSWKAREDFVLRLPMAGRVLEFPFALPAEDGDLILRKRTE